MKPCWSCGVVDGPCEDVCACAKCIDPFDYDRWRNENPRSYALWMARNLEDPAEAQEWLDRADELEDYW
jgi:hypothetical protein